MLNEWFMWNFFSQLLLLKCLLKLTIDLVGIISDRGAPFITWLPNCQMLNWPGFLFHQLYTLSHRLRCFHWRSRGCSLPWSIALIFQNRFDVKRVYNVSCNVRFRFRPCKELLMDFITVTKENYNSFWVAAVKWFAVADLGVRVPNNL